MIKLFDVHERKLIPTEHCYTLKFLKDIMDDYPQDYLKVYLYLFYMSCPNPDLNPFFGTPEEDKEELIMRDIDAEFTLDDPIIVHALERTRQLYETPTSRAYEGIATALDNIADYFKKNKVDGSAKDGNGAFILRAAKDFAEIRKSFKDTYNDLMEENESKVRGNKNLAYDA